ncbi:alpha/beta hydrolase [Flavobacterium gilvum]|uniref:Esterase n=1 Tax=Flavobacterium gilvum TaxID=1492737 RepID=A0AAC9N6K3_9FLAO|nr:alpha/beta hydrolase [Flavobacterium gilvum]AOW09764.1 esterase [Flavobacterium gilvum]KFC60377.1 esterase [Flavobacterium gilvum]
MRKIAVILLLISTAIQAQPKYVIDTTYTPKSVYNKEKKSYPFISLVQPKKHSNITEKKEVVYSEISDRKLHFDAYFCDNKKTNPAIVILHGGGWKSGNKSQMEIFAQEVASKGFSCFTVEYRLSQEAKYPTAIFDVKKAIRYIRKNAVQFNTNPAKIAILGCSSGGQMAALIGTTNNNKLFEEKEKNNKVTSAVQAIIDIDGILSFKHPESKEGEIAGLWLGGNYETVPENWKEASALTHTNKNTPPILFINSSKERFHAGRDDMITILNQHKIYNEVKTIENSPHSFWFLNPWFDETVTYTTTFLNKVFE